MQSGFESTTDAGIGKPFGQNDLNSTIQQSSSKSSYPIVAGILLIISGAVALIYWAFIVSNVDLFTSTIDISYLQSIDPNITEDYLRQVLVLCGTIFAVIAIFPLIGGILSLKKKLWVIAFVCSIIGLFSMGILFTSSILSLVALFLLAFSKI